ncbi:MAG TPA: hypothetical protein VIY49_16615 [Bryobacteraceae bacterium]
MAPTNGIVPLGPRVTHEIGAESGFCNLPVAFDRHEKLGRLFATAEYQEQVVNWVLEVVGLKMKLGDLPLVDSKRKCAGQHLREQTRGHLVSESESSATSRFRGCAVSGHEFAEYRGTIARSTRIQLRPSGFRQKRQLLNIV